MQEHNNSPASRLQQAELFARALWEKTAANLRHLLKWLLISSGCGIILGLVGISFYYAMNLITSYRSQHSFLLYLLPVGGLIIVGLYQLMKRGQDTGTNLVIDSLHGKEQIPTRNLLLIYVTTLITHLFGGSAGREGAALQMGGSAGSRIATLLKLDQNDRSTVILCGMSAAFSSLFGTPLAAAFFSMEVVTVGMLRYYALLPCVVASLIAHQLSSAFGVHAEAFLVQEIPEFASWHVAQIILLAVCCAAISICFCSLLHTVSSCYRRFLPNPYLRAAIGGILVVLLTLLVGHREYNGAGISIIERCFEENTARPEAFLMKMLFTALTLGAGYKGGEIVPSLYIGATFGCVFGPLIGLSSDISTAAGMAAVFCGVTNCPVTSLFLSFELFGFEGMPYYLVAVAAAYLLSGYYGLYSSQRFVLSKKNPEVIDLRTK